MVHIAYSVHGATQDCLYSTVLGLRVAWWIKVFARRGQAYIFDGACSTSTAVISPFFFFLLCHSMTGICCDQHTCLHVLPLVSPLVFLGLATVAIHSHP